MSLNSHNLVLYHGETCKYCLKVRRFLSENNIEVPLKEVWGDEAAFEELRAINNGKTQVPCLVIDGKPMLESDDIIAWFKANQ
jgi:glutaredoxin 3